MRTITLIVCRFLSSLGEYAVPHSVTLGAQCAMKLGLQRYPPLERLKPGSIASMGVHSAARVKVWRLRYLAPNRVLLVAAGASSDFPEAHEPLPPRTMGHSGSSSAQQGPSPPPAGEASHPEPQLCAPPSVPISMFRTLKWGLGPQPVPLPSPVPVSCA